jgi:hypothetical protein
MEGDWSYSEAQDDEHDGVDYSHLGILRTEPYRSNAAWYIISLWASCRRVWRLFTFTPSDSSRAPLWWAAPGMCPKIGRLGTQTWYVSRAIAWPTYTDYLRAALLARLIFIYLHFVTVVRPPSSLDRTAEGPECKVSNVYRGAAC